MYIFFLVDISMEKVGLKRNLRTHVIGQEF